MRYLYIFFLMAVCQVSLAAVTIDSRKEYKLVNLADFIAENQISEKMIEKKQRLMILPDSIRFEGTLKSLPKQGRFELVYDALQLWDSDAEMPNVDHSAFITSQDAPVIAVYVSHEAATYLKQVGLDEAAIFYAVHIYNYAGGPRLVIIAAESTQTERGE